MNAPKARAVGCPSSHPLVDAFFGGAAVLLSLGCVPLLATADMPAGATTEVALEHDGMTRTVALHLPPAPKPPYPLVIALHGGASSGDELEDVTGFSRIADREGFAVAYPNGTGGAHGIFRTWNDGHCCGMSHFLDVDDVGLLPRLLEGIGARIAIDPDRVYLVGYSNGGALAYEGAARMSERLAGLAVYAASMPAAGPFEAPRFFAPIPEAPLSVLLIMSEADPRLPYFGRDGVEVDTSQAQIARFWASSAGCRGRPRRTRRESVIEASFVCPPGLAVSQLTLYGWDHEWPGPANIKACRRPAEPLYDFDAAEVIWRFFRDKRRHGAVAESGSRSGAVTSIESMARSHEAGSPP